MIRRWLITAALALLAAAPESGTAQESKELVLYCGRGQSLVGPLIVEFEKQTGIKVQVKYAGTAQLAGILQEEGANSPADVFWAQDAASLATLASRGSFIKLSDTTLAKVSDRFRSG